MTNGLAERKKLSFRRSSRLWTAIAVLGLLALCMPLPTRADTVTELSVTFAPPAGSPLAGGTLTGNIQLYTTDSAGNIVALGSPTPLPSIDSSGSVVLTWDTVTSAPCWISFAGLDTVAVTIPDPSYPVFAFSSDPTTWIEPSNLNQPPLVFVGMLNGATSESASGALVAFGMPNQVGSWSITETVPEPATLPLTLLGAGLAGLVCIVRKGQVH